MEDRSITLKWTLDIKPEDTKWIKLVEDMSDLQDHNCQSCDKGETNETPVSSTQS